METSFLLSLQGHSPVSFFLLLFLTLSGPARDELDCVRAACGVVVQCNDRNCHVAQAGLSMGRTSRLFFVDIGLSRALHGREICCGHQKQRNIEWRATSPERTGSTVLPRSGLMLEPDHHHALVHTNAYAYHFRLLVGKHGEISLVSPPSNTTNKTNDQQGQQTNRPTASHAHLPERSSCTRALREDISSRATQRR